MSISIRSAKEVLSVLKKKTQFNVKFTNETKEVCLTKKYSLIGKGRFGGTDIVFEGSDGNKYFIKDMQSTVKNVGPNTPSEGINKIFSIAKISSSGEEEREVFFSTKREPKKHELSVYVTPLKVAKEISQAVKILKRTDNWKEIVPSI